MRIQKYLRMCGIASRRQAEELVRNGRIKVNGRTILDYVQVEKSDVVEFDGKVLLPRKKVYYMFNKPIGYITTKRDPRGRKTIFDLLVGIESDVFPVGRLDKDTSGLLLLTNDGEITQLLLHPKYEIDRVYVAKIEGKLSRATIEKMSKGIKLPYGYISKMEVSIMQAASDTSKVKIVIRQGRKREIRRVFKFVGHQILELQRISFGPIELDKDLKLGEYRQLTQKEIRSLEEIKKMRPFHRVSP